jgi:hypothetical protein
VPTTGPNVVHQVNTLVKATVNGFGYDMAFQRHTLYMADTALAPVTATGLAK